MSLNKLQKHLNNLLQSQGSHCQCYFTCVTKDKIKNLFHSDTSMQLRLLQMPSLKLVRDLKMVKDYIQCTEWSMNFRLNFSGLCASQIFKPRHQTKQQRWTTVYVSRKWSLAFHQVVIIRPLPELKNKTSLVISMHRGQQKQHFVFLEWTGFITGAGRAGLVVL